MASWFGDLGYRTARSFFSSGLLHPPWPLQVFLPLQPLSPVLQPPWPLQVFLPLQSCFPFSWSSRLMALTPRADFLIEVSLPPLTGSVEARAAVPSSRPL